MERKPRKSLEMIGRPFPISELPSRRKKVDEHLAVLNGIPKKSAAQVSLSYAGVREVIRRLEESGQIAKGEFEVHLHTDGDQKQVFVAHNAETGPRKRRHGFREADPEVVLAYIKSKRNYEHTLAEIQLHLFSRIGSPRTDPEIYYPAFLAARVARRTLEESEGGKFVSVRRSDGTKLYTFQPSKG